MRLAKSLSHFPAESARNEFSLGFCVDLVRFCHRNVGEFVIALKYRAVKTCIAIADAGSLKRAHQTKKKRRQFVDLEKVLRENNSKENKGR